MLQNPQLANLKSHLMSENVLLRILIRADCYPLFTLLCHLRRDARETMFRQLNGDRPFAPNYLVLITDGRSNNRTLTWYEAIATRAQAITILAVS